MIFLRHAVIFLATVGYIGRIPVAPGTFGSLVGIPIAYLLSGLRWEIAAAGMAAMILFAVATAHMAERLLQIKDPGCIVIDEMVGMCITLTGTQLNLFTCVAGFLLFRFFDITKVPPIRTIERRLPGGWGVVLDDVTAGMMSWAILQAGIYVTHHVRLS
jgi:phosphatidylglycerophosphatase A